MGDPRGAIKKARKEGMKDSVTEAKKEVKKGPPLKKLIPRNIIRVADTDLDGNKQVAIALMKIKGVGYNFGRAICHATGIDYTKKLAELSEADIEKLEKAIENPLQLGIPTWMLDRQKDREKGLDMHISGADLPLKWREDIELQKKLRTWRGIRHELGLPVRGQHTRTAQRKGARMGVQRKKVMPGTAAAKPAAAAEKKK